MRLRLSPHQWIELAERALVDADALEEACKVAVARLAARAAGEYYAHAARAFEFSSLTTAAEHFRLAATAFRRGLSRAKANKMLCLAAICDEEAATTAAATTQWLKNFRRAA